METGGNRGTTQESGALTPDDRGGPGWAGHSSALEGRSAGCSVSSYRWSLWQLANITCF